MIRSAVFILEREDLNKFVPNVPDDRQNEWTLNNHNEGSLYIKSSKECLPRI